MNLLFAWTGLYCMLSQVLLFRELAVVFLGQEIALSVALAAWLLWSGAGAIRVSRCSEAGRSLPVYLGALACAMPLSALAIRLSRLLIPAGRIPGLFATVILPFAVLGPACWLIGAAFAGGAVWAEERRGAAGPARIYAWESAGAVAGGLLSTLLFRQGWPSFLTLAAGGLLLAALTVGFFRHPRGRWTVFFAAASLLIATFSHPLDRASRRAEWRGYDLLVECETPYEHVALARLGEAQILFENGAVSAQFPDPAAQEELVHWPLLAHPAPRQVLALGTPAATALGEILKHPVESVDLVAPDPAALQMLELPQDRRIHQSISDPRLWIKHHPQTYDVILQTLPEPQNAASNRLFTAQFFVEARRALRPGGLLAFRLASSENYLPPETAYTDASLLRTVAQAFPYVEEIPGARLIVLAGDRPISLDPVLLANRYRARQIHNRVLIPELFPWALHPERRNALRLRLEAVPHVMINSDLWPVSMFQVWRVWLAKFIEPAQMVGLFAALLAAAGIVRLVWRRRRAQFQTPECTLLLTMGFAGMSLEIVLLYLFQAVSGSLYWQLGVLLAAFMAGLAAGSGLFALNAARKYSLLFLSSAAGALTALCAILAWKAPQLFSLQSPLVAFSGLLAAAGFLVGAAFPLALARSPGQAASLYAADLWGSALGAFLSGLFLVPLFGHRRTLALSTLTLSGALAFLLTSRLRRTPRS